MGKTRVAPIKPQTIPRLELSGAVLLARLMASLQSAFNLAEVAVHTWTDSTMALGWIRSHSSKWKPGRNCTSGRRDSKSPAWSNVEACGDPGQPGRSGH